MNRLVFAKVARYLGAFVPRHDRIHTYFRPTQTYRFKRLSRMYGKFKHWNETHGDDSGQTKTAAPARAAKGGAAPSNSGGMDFTMSQDEMFKTLKNAPASKCHSLVKKYLTDDVYEKLKDKKTKLGGTLAHCINTGAVNLDSGVGCMACDPEAYDVFADLLDNVIKDYHKFPMDQPIKHPAADFGDLENLPFGDLDPTGEYVLSTRVRVGRSNNDIANAALMSVQDRKSSEDKAKAAYASLTGEFKGTYYSLETMSPQEERQLIEDHFLFKNDDRFNEAAGVYRDWPKSRGIFHNPAKTFLSWVNEEDQLRIISMQQGGNLGEVYKRLCTGINHIGKVINYSHSDRLGYLTFCPTNLGTTLRASVHMRIPLFSADMDRLNKICAEYNIQPRGMHGEHTESVGGVFDLSNKRRLGLTEIEAVTEMANGVKAIMAEEAKLRALEPRQQFNMTQDQMFAKLQAAKPEECHSLVQKYLTPEVYAKLKDKKTKLGGTLAHCINTGAENIDSGVGCMASDSEAYEVFADLFDNIIKDYHKFPMDKPIKHPAPDFGDIENFSIGDLDTSGKGLIISTRVRVGRSFANIGNAPISTLADRAFVEQRAKEAFASLPDEYAGKYYSLETMSAEDEQQLIDDHFLFKNDDRFNEQAGVYRDWPKSRGIFHNPAKNFLVWLNEEDNLRLISMQMGGNLGEVFKRLVKGIRLIEKKVPFAHSDRLGYLTFCPTNLGTTLRASVHMRLAHLGNDEAKLKEICAKYNIQPRGIHGEHTESVGNIFDLSNKRRLGLTEIEAVTEMATGVAAILAEEERLCALEPRQQFTMTQDEMFKNISTASDAECHSLVRKYLTPDVYAKLKDKKTKLGGTLAHCINTGAVNIDSGVGCMASDPEAYEVFADLLDNIIKDYHKFPMDKPIKHPAPDFGDLENLPFGDLSEISDLIVSSRIRVGRSVANMSCAPLICMDDRKYIETLAKQAFDALEGDYRGTYHSLENMTDEVEKQLIADHFLFKNDDRFNEAAGVYRDWPKSRGIFHNPAKNFLVWLNEEDCLRIISMQMGGNLAEVYKRLVKGIKLMERKIAFAHSDRFGYLTFCPTNLGTTLRASVHMKIPNLAQDKDRMNAICAQYNIQPRGIHGEHTESVGGVYDLSNKRRLGLSEIEAVTEMATGVKAIMLEELRLAGGNQTKQ